MTFQQCEVAYRYMLDVNIPVGALGLPLSAMGTCLIAYGSW